MSFLTDQITAQQQIIAALVLAITQLSIDGVVSYELDTGQNKQRVTRADLPALIKARQDSMNYLAELERAAGVTSSVITVRPDF